MLTCRNCTYYNNENSYPNSGFCELYGDYVRNYQIACDDFREEGEY